MHGREGREQGRERIEKGEEDRMGEKECTRNIIATRNIQMNTFFYTLDLVVLGVYKKREYEYRLGYQVMSSN